MKCDVESYRVLIFGDEYKIVSDESECHVLQVANYVHALMQEIAQKTPHAHAKEVAVLAALQLASKIITAEEKAKKHDELNSEILGLIDRELQDVSSQ